ncbi:MAG: hypothetical protein JNJ53_04110 [Rhizobiales bacterium]|nr:hypothetical protein [Hyphomicrobiales bacterium]
MTKLFFDDTDFDDQLQRTMSAAYVGSADLGEALATAQRIKPGDPVSWFDCWSDLAGRVEATAQEQATRGHRANAANNWLRASEYWRQSFFFIRRDIEDARLQQAWRAHRAAFRAWLTLTDYPTTGGEIPFDSVHMTAYLMRPPGPVKSRPTLIIPAGYDSTAEEGYCATGFMALAHDLNALIWEGPGQGGVLYEDKLPTRPDFETVLPPIIDWLLAQDGVDPKSLILVGRSFAGYLAPRAAAHEKRLKALVCDPGQYDFVSRFLGSMIDEATWKKILARDPAVDAKLQHLMDAPGKVEWYGARMATQGAKSVGDFMRLQPLYRLEGQAELITCPTLIVDCEGDFASQGDKLYAALKCPKTMLKLDAASGAGGMGQLVWQNAIFAWIEDVLAS